MMTLWSMRLILSAEGWCWFPTVVLPQVAVQIPVSARH